MTDTEDRRITDLKFRTIERRQDKTDEVLESIAESIKTLARVEVQHAETRESLLRAFKAIEDNRKDYEDSCDLVDKRVKEIELQMPILKMTSRWIIGGTLAIVTAAFSTLGMIAYAMFEVLPRFVK